MNSQIETIAIDLSKRTKLKKAGFKNRTDIGKVILPSTEVIPMDCFFNNINLHEIVLPNGIKSLDSWCFGNCEKLNSLELPESLEEIKNNAFKLCASIKYISFLGTNIKTISRSAFASCIDVEELIIPDGVEIIEESAFSDMLRLKTVSLPSSIKRIDKYAFKNCVSLESVNIRGEFSQDTTIDENAFKNCPLL